MASPDFNPFGLFSVCYWVFTASSKNPKTLICGDKKKTSGVINYRLFIDNTVVLWINFEFKKILIDWAHECGTWLGPLHVQLYSMLSLIIFSMSG